MNIVTGENSTTRKPERVMPLHFHHEYNSHRASNEFMEIVKAHKHLLWPTVNTLRTWIKFTTFPLNTHSPRTCLFLPPTHPPEKKTKWKSMQGITSNHYLTPNLDVLKLHLLSTIYIVNSHSIKKELHWNSHIILVKDNSKEGGKATGSIISRKNITSMNPLPVTVGIEQEKLRYWSSSCALNSSLSSINSWVASRTRYFPSTAQSNLG